MTFVVSVFGPAKPEICRKLGWHQPGVVRTRTTANPTARDTLCYAHSLELFHVAPGCYRAAKRQPLFLASYDLCSGHPHGVGEETKQRAN
jgi:hypothetical protein